MMIMMMMSYAVWIATTERTHTQIIADIRLRATW